MAHDFEAVPAFDPASGFEPGDASLVERCQGPTLDVGAGPGRLTVALTERGIPALGIDVTPNAVRQTRSAGALALMRDVFGHIPGAGRWRTILLADGAIGIGGDPAALLRRIRDLLAPQGRALVELQPPGDDGPAGADQIDELARTAGMELRELWTESGRWFAELDGCRVVKADPVTTVSLRQGQIGA
jgi:SAM-dependent methyltransferase